MKPGSGVGTVKHLKGHKTTSDQFIMYFPPPPHLALHLYVLVKVWVF